MADAEQPKRRIRWLRWLAAGCGLIVVALIGLLVSLPAILSSGSLRGWLLSQANASLAPSRLEVSDFQFAWSGPTLMRGFRLIDPEGRPVLSAETASLSQGLRALINERPRFGTLELENGSLHIVRDANGSTNLQETLRPLMTGDPEFDLRFVSKACQLRLEAPELPAPLVTSNSDVDLHLAARPKPVTWTIRLGGVEGADAATELTTTGSLDAWTAPAASADQAPMTAQFKARRWPLQIQRANLLAVATAEVDAAVERTSKGLVLAGSLGVDNLTISGEPLRGDRLELDRVNTTFDVSQVGDAWSIRRLDLKSSVAELTTSTVEPATAAGMKPNQDLERWLPGMVPPAPSKSSPKSGIGPIRLVGTVRAGALAAQLPHLMGQVADLGLGDVAGSVQLADEARSIKGSVRTIVTVADSPKELRVDFDSKRSEGIVDLESLILELAEPTARDASKSLARLETRGQFDTNVGQLKLTPAGQAEVAGIRLAERGLEVQGLGGKEPLRASVGLEGRLESLDDLLGDAERWDLTGPWSAQGSIEPEADGLALKAQLDAVIPRHDAADGGESLSAVVDGRYLRSKDTIELEQLAVLSKPATLRASGRLVDLKGKRTLTLDGEGQVDTAEIERVANERFEPGVTLSAGPMSFSVSGDLRPSGTESTATLGSLDGKIAWPIRSAASLGLELGEFQLDITKKGDTVTIAPIQTTLNGGKLRLEPLVGRDDRGRLVGGLGRGTTLEGAAINERVSDRILAYVAPVLSEAARPRGFVSASIEHAIFPLEPSDEARTEVEGIVVFQDVEFIPGNFARSILAALNREDATLRLNNPIQLMIADGRVYQTGLSVPLGNVTEFALEGWVDFDRNLDMVAYIPLRPKNSREGNFGADVLGDARFELPIRGTLSDPKLDGRALAAGMGNMGLDLLNRTISRGIGGLMNAVTRPRDPNAPTPEQRREMLRQRREQRRLEQQLRRQQQQSR